MIPWDLQIQPADLFFTRNGGFVSQAIRFFSWGWGQPYPAVSHVGGFVEEGLLFDVDCVEALNKVERHRFWEEYYNSTSQFVIARPTNISEQQRNQIRDDALAMVGEKYGYLKIAAHLADAALLGANVFRRLTNNKTEPICSWVWAYAFRAAGLDFGVDYGAAQPDDMYNFCVNNPDKYEMIVPEFAVL